MNQPPRHGDSERDRKSNLGMTERLRKPENPSREKDSKAGTADRKTKDQ